MERRPKPNIVFVDRTWEARMTASLWRKRVKWLVRLNGPVSHFPAGTYSMAPPASSPEYCDRWSTAERNAAVLEVVPSPTPPKSASDAVCARQAGARYMLCPVPCAGEGAWWRPDTAADAARTRRHSERRICSRKQEAVSVCASEIVCYIHT